MPPIVGFMYAHPDDESFLSACLIRQIVDRGGKAVLLTATKGDAGQTGLLGEISQTELALLRVKELAAAGDILGLSDIHHLGLPDRKLADHLQTGLVQKVIAYINQQQAEIIVSFAEDGGNGHPDHIAIHQATAAAMKSGQCPSVQKLYVHASPIVQQQGHQATYQIDTYKEWEVKAAALRAHESQRLVIAKYFGDLQTIPQEAWRYETFVLAWERGVWWPGKQEHFIFDDLQS
jgi:LmbE family N-acetylglucosaminyl deacetylase